MTITKKDICKDLSKKTRIQEKYSSKLLDSFINLIRLNSKISPVKIHNFGTFQYKLTPARFGRNPTTGVEYPINARSKLTFKSSFRLKKNIN